MAVRIVFLGRLADLAGASERELAAPLDWLGLLAGLEGELASAVSDAKVRLAVNGALLPDKAVLAASEGDEVALLPPVSGG
ncbi:molybdopterin synthase sulfur carrier subunit [Croceicoccus estronivorus]|uniref:MoaD/ThiS family protein n=1 Tax=Croceicoccus estronivorus TaxID=1172626 RepID=UPI00082A6AD8|nr:MoaD/ThiS family protein [Croceicoccus estronivorus]OCC24970.1 molybdopterin synthase sulfur carrier subunit [Croceicoccus estronivorus]